MSDHPQGCDCCGETTEEMFLHSKCHTGVPTWVSMTRDGILIVRCAECGKEVTRFKASQLSEAAETLQ